MRRDGVYDSFHYVICAFRQLKYQRAARCMYDKLLQNRLQRDFHWQFRMYPPQKCGRRTNSIFHIFEVNRKICRMLVADCRRRNAECARARVCVFYDGAMDREIALYGN